jgi:hypothetical protein
MYIHQGRKELDGSPSEPRRMYIYQNSIPTRWQIKRDETGEPRGKIKKKEETAGAFSFLLPLIRPL